MMKICSKCIYDERTSGISFNDSEVCNFCIQVEDLARQYNTGNPKGEEKLRSIIDGIKKAGRDKKYDCVIGVSGGTDSSYLLIEALKWGLRPLAVHYDNTWNSSIATENIRKVTSKLKVDLYTYVVDNKEADDIFKSFLLAGVPEFDASTDIGFVQVLRSAAAKYGIKYILEGHSFMAEGVSPQGNNYFDGKYIQSIHNKYGKLKMKTYPNLTFYQFLKWVLVYRQKFIRPLWYINYSKPEARKVLEETTGWTYYGGHHLENRSTSFLHTIYNPQKFGIDNRNWSLSAEARTGVISREKALEIYNTPIIPDPELVEYVKKRLSLSDAEYEAILNGPKRSNKDFKTYKRRFEFMRPLFYVLSKAELVPKSFYIKYCFPFPNE
jgi:N-acetyl sugar amidotransferase